MAVPEWLSRLIATEIDDGINNDPRTTSSTFLGHPRDQVFWGAIGGGQADFDSAVGNLSPDDRVLLYAKFNQRRHLDELHHAFRILLGECSDIHRPTVLDIGCGPFTGFLAFAAAIGGDTPFRYFGIDRARSMLRLGVRLAEKACEAGEVHERTTWHAAQNLADLNFGPVRGEWTIVVASYLLASKTIDVASLVDEILFAAKSIGPGPVAILHTNTPRGDANAKYPAFSQALASAGFDIVAEDTERFADTTKEPKELHYALFCRKPSHTLARSAGALR